MKRHRGRNVHVRRSLGMRQRFGTLGLGLLVGTCIMQQTMAGEGSPTEAFDQTLALYGITFHVSCPNDSSMPTLSIVPSGLELDNASIVRTIDGIVTGMEIADLNADQSPEIYVYVQSVGSGSYGSLVAYGANNRKSLSEIYLPPVTENAEAAKGYMGHDEFAVVESNFVQRFPIYREGDTNANPTGGTRQLQYELTLGEASWILKLDKIVDY